MPGNTNKRTKWSKWKKRVLLFSLGPIIPAILFLIYAGPRLLATPKITHNYAAEFNSRYDQIPESEMAWPMYREAAIFMLEHPKPDSFGMNMPETPQWSNWDEALVWLDEVQPALVMAREASLRPVLGKELSDQPDPILARAMAEAVGLESNLTPPSANPVLLDLALWDISQFRKIEETLKLDSFRAAEIGDSVRIVRNTEAMLRISVHAAEDNTLIRQVYRLGFDTLTCQTTRLLLNRYSHIFSEDDLVQLQDAFMHIGQPEQLPEEGLTQITIDYEMNRLVIADLLQRTFSDDGHGDGHLTLPGARLIADGLNLTTPVGSSTSSLALIASVLKPSSRKAITDRFDEIADFYQMQSTVLPWLRGAQTGDGPVRAPLSNSKNADRARPFFVDILQPALEQAILSTDRINASHDATIAVIALYHYRLAHGVFPQSLAELVPEFLPRLPLDPMDGRPLRYRMTSDGPLLYSISADGVDDGGQRNEFGQNVYPGEPSYHSGDWVLYPEIVPVENEDE
jgi:hypothetical protein